MTTGLRGAVSTAAVALGVCAASPARAGAQVPVRSDTAIASATADRPQRPDSVQARFARARTLPTLEIGEPYTFDARALERTGALTLADLLDRVPGITTFRTGWLPSPQTAAYAGDFARIRVFFDGVEWDDLNARDGAAPDLRSVPLWTLRQVTLERTPLELRIHLRTWEYDRTAPYTRVDALTGDLNTNLYDGYYAKRFYNGAGLQFAARQYGTTNNREGGGGDETGVFLRYGVARARWSVDVAAIRLSDTRSQTARLLSPGSDLPAFRGTSTLAYARAALGHVRRGAYLQLVAAANVFRENSTHVTASQAAGYGIPADTADSAASLAQYTATAGWSGGGLDLRLVERYRRRLARGYSSPVAEAAFARGPLAATARLEHDGYWGGTRSEIGARITPLPFVAVTGAVGTWSPGGTPAPRRPREPASRAARLEGGIRVGGGLWLTGGVLTRDTALVAPPSVYDTAYVVRPVGRESAVIASLRGPLAYGFSVDATATHWREPGPYTPRYQARAQLQYYTEWLQRFPSGNFSFLLAPRIDYRSRVAFPTAAGDVLASPSRVVSVVAELRILRAVITFEHRNLATTIYDQVPGFVMPRGTNVYGVRWYFFD